MQRNQLFRPKQIAPVVLMIIDDLLSKEHYQVSHCFEQLKHNYGRPFATEILEGVLIEIQRLRGEETGLRDKSFRFSMRKTLLNNVQLTELENKILRYQGLQRIMINVMSERHDDECMYIDL